MNAVDVRAVMAQDAYDAGQYRGVIGASKADRMAARARSDEARAAVAELIDASNAVRNEMRESGTVAFQTWQRFHAALAQVQGDKP